MNKGIAATDMMRAIMTFLNIKSCKHYLADTQNKHIKLVKCKLEEL